MPGGQFADLALVLQRHIGGGDAQDAAVGHGVARIDHEVEQGTFQLVLVAVDGPEPGLQRGFDADMAAQRAAQQVAHRIDQFVQFDPLEIQRLASGEGQQAVGQRGGAVGRGGRGLDEALGFVVATGLDVALGQVEPADDAGEHIVEVVGDAAGELADRFHLLRLAQRGLGLFAGGHFLEQTFVDLRQRLGALLDAALQRLVEFAQGPLGLAPLADVLGKDEEALHHAVLVATRQVLHQHVPCVLAGLEGDRAAGESGANALRAVGVGLLAEDFAKLAADQPCLAEPFAAGAIVEAETFLAVDVGDQYGQGIGDDLQLGLAVAQRGLRQARLGAHALAGFAEAQQQPADTLPVVADRAEGEVEPGFDEHAVALERQLLVVQYAGFAAAGDIAGRGEQFPGRAPAVAGGLAEFGGMATADQRGMGIVVQLQRLLAPENAHRQRGLEDGVEQHAQGRRPAPGRPQLRRTPVVPTDPLAHLAVTVGPEVGSCC